MLKNNFLGLPPEDCIYKNCYFCVIPVPFEKTTSYKKGTKYGPLAIINASTQVEVVDEEYLITPYQMEGITTTTPVYDHEAPNLLNKLADAVSKSVKDKKFPIILGGEHAISEGVSNGLLKHYTDLSVLQFDAHCDLRPEYEGTIYNHACAMFRIKDKCKLAQIGIRSIAEEELPYINKGNVKTFFIHKWHSRTQELIKEMLNHLSNNVFITIDLDGLDPNVIPGVGTPVPGGFTFEQALTIIKEVIMHKNVVGADVVELCPELDEIISPFSAAKLAHKIIAYQTAKKHKLSPK
ncbi:MAG: agmatinase [Planctomycetes bacterium]|nr:agmatinase [Planctomycetota bacterium]